VHGFTEAKPITKLANYLSKEWLATAHATHQLDLLQWNIARSGMDPQSFCKVVNPDFFRKMVQIYCTKDATPYGAIAGPRGGGTCHLWNVGEELANGIQTTVVGIVNVDDNHWVAVVVDTVRATIQYGDSLEGDGAEVKAVVEWWVNAHILHRFSYENLPITHQRDGHLCLLFAANEIGHFILPAQIPLLQADAATTSAKRISMFVRVTQCDSELMSHYVNKYLSQSWIRFRSKAAS
jgi:hypothetical protein